MGFFLEKLDLSDETIVGVGQMRTTADVMCYNGVVCACKKGENLGSSPVLSKKTNMCSIPGEQTVLNAKISAWDKSMSWIMTLQLLSQMQDTELQLNTYHNVTMYNVTMNACEKEDQW